MEIVPIVPGKLAKKYLIADYCMTQKLLTGHMELSRRTCLSTEYQRTIYTCDDCGQVDTSTHALLFCEAYDGVRVFLQNKKCDQLNVGWPPDISALLEIKELTDLLCFSWHEIKEMREL